MEEEPSLEKTAGSMKRSVFFCRDALMAALESFWPIRLDYAKLTGFFFEELGMESGSE